MRDALSNKVAVVIDERDQRDLADREAEHEEVVGPTIEHIKVTRRVRVTLPLLQEYLSIHIKRSAYELSTTSRVKKRRLIRLTKSLSVCHELK